MTASGYDRAAFVPELYDHVIVNDDLARAVAQARDLVDRHLGTGSARARR